MSKKTATFLLFFLVALLSLVTDSFAGTCALCRQNLAIGGSNGLIKGIYWSIILIAGMPFIIFVGFFSAYSFRARKERKQSRVPAAYHFDI